jgi:hypothetical protein
LFLQKKCSSPEQIGNVLSWCANCTRVDIEKVAAAK